MQVLLANPKSSSVFDSFGFVFPPLGLLYIAAVAEKDGHSVKIEDFCVSGNNPSTYSFRNYDIVGISVNTRRFSGAMEIAKKAKEQGCKVIMGGPHPTFADEEILRSGYVDYIVDGEGEITFVNLLREIGKDEHSPSIKGIRYISNSNIIRNPPPDLIKNLDDLPFPGRHLIDIALYKKKGFRYGGKRPITVLSSSRGCLYSCNFCVTPQLYGNVWRARSASSVVAEIEELYYKYDYKAVAFCDDNFTIDPQRVKEICSMIIEKGLDVWLWCLSSSNILLKNEDMVRLMAKAGVKTIYIGVESASQTTLKEFNKGTTNEIAAQTVSLLRKNGIETFASYILGGLNDSFKTILQTIDLSKKLNTETVQFSILTPYPGTVLFKNIEQTINHKRWQLYDGVHLVFRHKNVPFLLMQMLLVWAYLSYYTRNWHSISGFLKTFIRNSPIMRIIRVKS